MQFPHGQPQPGQLVPQSLPLGVPQGEVPHALGEDAFRYDTLHGRTPQLRQQRTECRAQS
ncbi:hypothetical protein [Streptomyces labedae]|uniref:hypothetical protein n=1 Tax=Streptomyces labedae TaxID=285569 RepID=UPI0031F8D82E